MACLDPTRLDPTRLDHLVRLHLDLRRLSPRAAALVLVAAILILQPSPAHSQFSGPALTLPSLGGPVSSSPNTASRPHLLPAKLSPGDLVTVHLYGSSDYGPIVRINLDGTIQLPLIGIISVANLTVGQAEDLIEQRLKSEGMYLDPQITLEIAETSAQVVTVAGEAHTVIPVTGERHLLELLAIAGGLPPTASHRITVNRPGVDEPIVVDLPTDPLRSQQANILIYPGDTIVLARVGVVYLLGQFRAPGAIPITQNSPLTLMQATSLAGGALFNARYDDLRIIRTVDHERTLVKVDVKQVMLGKLPDPILQPDDILFLPTSPMKAALSSGGLSVLLNLASVMLIAFNY